MGLVSEFLKKEGVNKGFVRVVEGIEKVVSRIQILSTAYNVFSTIYVFSGHEDYIMAKLNEISFLDMAFRLVRSQRFCYFSPKMFDGLSVIERGNKNSS